MTLRTFIATSFFAAALSTMLVTAGHAQVATRTITVSGIGAAKVAPDQATVHMSIVAMSSSVEDAQREASGVTAKVLAMTDKLGIARTEIDSTGSTVRPDYRWNSERNEQELRGYVAERQLRVDVRDLDKLGALIERAVKLGVNQVSPPQLDSSERRSTYRAALEAAAKDAAANAATLAKALGANVGEVLQVTTESQATPPMPYMRTKMVGAGDAKAEETYNAATLEFEATVTAVFALQ